MATEPNHLFREQDVLDLISVANGANHCDISARATVQVQEGAATVELTSTLDIDCEQPSERFRVVVERVDGADRPEVLVEGSWFKVDDLPEILGNYMRSVSEHHRQGKELSMKLHESNARVGVLEGQLATAREGFDDWLLAPHHDTGGEYGLYHDCVADEAVIGISERSLRSVLDDVRDHECEEATTAPDTAMDEFEAADEAFRRWE